MKQILLSLKREIDKSTNLKNLEYPSICTCIYINIIDIDVHSDISNSSPLTHASFLPYLLACFQPPTSKKRHLVPTVDNPLFKYSISKYIYSSIRIVKQAPVENNFSNYSTGLLYSLFCI